MSEATTPAEYAKIQAGAAMYLEVLRDRPGKTDDFLAGLRSKLGWSPDEVIALQLRVADILMEVQQAAAGANLTPQELREWLVVVGKDLESKAMQQIASAELLTHEKPPQVSRGWQPRRQSR